ncbi:MAG: DUF411 domain-containing protein [Pseudomonadota bacterium]
MKSLVVAAALALGSPAVFAAPTVDVYKSPQCGCCGKWIEHMKQSGFEVIVHDIGDTSAIKARHGVPQDLASCHTATIEGYVVEGHVPAQDVKRLLAEKPKAKGLAVPGMPAGSPGMEGARKDPFDTVLFEAAGGRAVFARH